MAETRGGVVTADDAHTTGLLREIEEARAFVAARADVKPEVGIVLGTGLGQFAAAMRDPVVIPYADIPHFPHTKVESHAGDLILGMLSGRPTAVLSGRAHYYEGWSMRQVTFPVRVLRALGVDTLVVTNAAGGMNPLYEAADIVAVVDHINLMGDNPLIGPNEDSLGPRFPDMSAPYDEALREIARDVARERKIVLREGVYVAVPGPALETRAEYRMLRTLGADAVGMSTVPEVIAAVHGGMRVLGLSIMTDQCLPDALRPVTLGEIVEVAERAEPHLTALVRGVLERA